MTKISQPYDLFFKELLSRPERAGTLLRERLPREVVQFLSAKPPELVPGSFVEEQLRERRSDRLYRVETISGKTAFLYVLIEHKSTPDEKVGWQLLKYMGEILRQWEKENQNWKHLPAIVPFVFYHGSEEWKTPNEFVHLVDAEEAWRPYLLNFRFPVLDLGKIPDKDLSEDRRLYPWLLVMKYATRANQQMSIRELLIEALRAVPEDLFPIVFYLVQTYVYDEQMLRGIIREVRPEEEERMMSQFAQDIRKTARQEALIEGEVKGEAKLLLGLLSHRFQSLPNEVSKRVHSANPNDIETWARRVLDAKSLDEVFSE
ncbi:MAG: Rpn family recombination-promoting nuclease/putative transposase [Gammaproteobacteria bacterium]|nr:Rpn family recombination-promoting nuclease/putative transposase [Gammaproteobacteria bacterium]NNJ84107.1 Rpn family recombination-promoting nuclease/putative transposase [Gammaproteobacteria bacterium]